MDKNWLPIERKELAQLSFDNAMREHAELWDAWKLLEAKAQSTLATAGIFEAAAFAYVTQLTPKPGLPEKILLILLVTALAVSVVQAVLSIRVTSVASPHQGIDGYNDVMAIIDHTNPPDSLERRHENLVRDNAKRWCNTNENIRDSLEPKGKLLHVSQGSLYCAAVLVLPLVLITLLR